MTDNELLDKAIALRDYLFNNELDKVIESTEDINNEIKARSQTNADMPQLISSYIWEIASGSYNTNVEGYIYVVKNLIGLRERDRKRELFKLYNLALLSKNYNIISLDEFLDTYVSDKETFDSLSFMEKASVVKMLMRNQLDDGENYDKKVQYLELVKTWLKEAEDREEDSINDN